MEVYFSSRIASFDHCGITRRSACGSTIQRSPWKRDMPMARAAAIWPAGIERMAPRKYSA